LSGVIPEGGDLLSIYDRHKGKDPRTAAVLLSPAEGKVQVLVALTPPLVKEGADARAIFQAGAARIGGRGGGRPEMARGSGSEPAASGEALSDMLGALRKAL